MGKKHVKKSRKRSRKHSKIYCKRQRKQLQWLYTMAAVLWILLIYALGVYKAKSIIGYVILSFPLIIYALAFVQVGRIHRAIEKRMLHNDFLVIGILFASVLFEMSTHRYDHYTVPIIIAAFILLVFSSADVIMGKRGFSLSLHIKSIAKTAAITLFVFVIYVNISQKIPMKNRQLDLDKALSAKHSIDQQ